MNDLLYNLGKDNKKKRRTFVYIRERNGLFMSKRYERVLKCCEEIRKVTDFNFKPQTAVVLGSGLGAFADEAVKIEAIVNYSDISGFPVSTAPSHKGRFVFGYVGDVKVVVMQGRIHYYEGYSMEDVVLPIRVMKELGAEKLILTNAAGGVNMGFNAGDLMLITDQICLAPSPLIGENLDELGVRFPDMSKIYRVEMRAAICAAAAELQIPLKEGVYIQLTGPNYETPAEIRMARVLGADAVGMSTAAEAIAANHAGMSVAGISCISNLAAGMGGKALSQEEVEETAAIVAPRFRKLLEETIIRTAKIAKVRS